MVQDGSLLNLMSIVNANCQCSSCNMAVFIIQDGSLFNLMCNNISQLSMFIPQRWRRFLTSSICIQSRSKIEEQAINIRSKILNGFLGYHQEEFQYWSSMIPRTKPRDDQPSLKLRPVSPTAHTSTSTPPPPDSR